MSDRICWIDVPNVDDLDPSGQAAYDGVKRSDGSVHNLYKPFAGWPQPLAAADELYRDLMHPPDAPLPAWERELVATQVAILEDCAYATAHHGSNFRKLLGDEARGQDMLDCLKDEDLPTNLFDNRLQAILAYGRKLTLSPAAMEEADVVALRAAGLSEAEIFQVNQISANFNYWVRTINGLGIALGDERIGMDEAALERMAGPRKGPFV